MLEFGMFQDRYSIFYVSASTNHRRYPQEDTASYPVISGICHFLQVFFNENLLDDLLYNLSC